MYNYANLTNNDYYNVDEDEGEIEDALAINLDDVGLYEMGYGDLHYEYEGPSYEDENDNVNETFFGENAEQKKHKVDPRRGLSFEELQLKIFDVSCNGYSNSVFKWLEEVSSGEKPFGKKHECCNEIIHQIAEALDVVLNSIKNDWNSVVDGLKHKRVESRICIITLGVILQCFAEAGYFSSAVREWQKAFVLQIVSYFLHIAFRDITHYQGSFVYPPFLNSPLVTQPTGSGKTFAGLITCFCMMIRTRGGEIQLLAPPNGHAVWCAPTQLIVDDVEGKFKALVSTDAFAIILPGNVAMRNAVRRYISKGRGAMRPDIKNKMFAVMTFEYARTQLTNVILEDHGEPRGKRPPLLMSMRCCIIDEAHYLVKSEDRALVVDNILLSCRCFSIPILFLTATPDATPGGDFLKYSNALKIQQTALSAFPASFDVFDPEAARQHSINGKCVCLPRTLAEEYKKTYTGNKSLITTPNKLIAYRALMECGIINDGVSELKRSILFLQSVADTQYVTAYICGLYAAISCGAEFGAFAQCVENYASGYMNDYIDRENNIMLRDIYEGRFYLKNTTREKLRQCFLEGASDVIPNFEQLINMLGDLAKFPNANHCFTHFDCFIHYMCLSNNIVPYFSGVALDENAALGVKHMIMDFDDQPVTFALLITTSVILEGVNISGAEKIFISADGYSRITNTQYTQLQGRVGRNSDGYVETWMYALGGKWQKGEVYKAPCVKEEKAVRRLVESDDVIDRILFAKMLCEKLEEPTSDVVDCISKVYQNNSITNNYYRGEIVPRLASFYVPASVSDEQYCLDNDVGKSDLNTNDGELILMRLDKVHCFVSAFNSTYYNIFFRIYSNLTFSASSPHIMLNSISYIHKFLRQTLDYTLMHSDSIINRVPTALFVPLFAQYSFAFDFQNASLNVLDSKSELISDKLQKIGFPVEELTNNAKLRTAVCSVYEETHPGTMLSSKDINNIEYAVRCLAASMFVDPHFWFATFHLSFSEALSTIVSYLNTLRSVLAELDTDYIASTLTLHDTPYAICANRFIDTVDHMLEDIACYHLSPFIIKKQPRLLEDLVVVHRMQNQEDIPDLQARVGMKYISYASRATNTTLQNIKPEQLEEQYGFELTACKNYLEHTPGKVEYYNVSAGQLHVFDNDEEAVFDKAPAEEFLAD